MNDFAKVGPGDHVEGALHEVGVPWEGKPGEGDEAVFINGHRWARLSGAGGQAVRGSQQEAEDYF